MRQRLRSQLQRCILQQLYCCTEATASAGLGAAVQPACSSSHGSWRGFAAAAAAGAAAPAAAGGGKRRGGGSGGQQVTVDPAVRQAAHELGLDAVDLQTLKGDSCGCVCVCVVVSEGVVVSRVCVCVCSCVCSCVRVCVCVCCGGVSGRGVLLGAQWRAVETALCCAPCPQALAARPRPRSRPTPRATSRQR
jgi:hypothetical protein